MSDKNVKSLASDCCFALVYDQARLVELTNDVYYHFQEAANKLLRAEKDRLIIEEKVKLWKKPIGLAKPIGPKVNPLITHRGYGAFCKGDFKKRPSDSEPHSSDDDHKTHGHESDVDNTTKTAVNNTMEASAETEGVDSDNGENNVVNDSEKATDNKQDIEHVKGNDNVFSESDSNGETEPEHSEINTSVRDNGTNEAKVADTSIISENNVPETSNDNTNDTDTQSHEPEQGEHTKPLNGVNLESSTEEMKSGENESTERNEELKDVNDNERSDIKVKGIVVADIMNTPNGEVDEVE